MARRSIISPARTALASCRAQGMTNAQIAQRYGTSTQLSDWRIRMTGVDVQRRRAAGRDIVGKSRPAFRAKTSF